MNLTTGEIIHCRQLTILPKLKEILESRKRTGFTMIMMRGYNGIQPQIMTPNKMI
jgi:hypothetical protein